ncbi:sulfotransferase [Elysia marginata]|uniref:Sulfotransferase n=1 Tax=Elysia marginata TaxID=1093978 RepID=A0AAV4JNJ1_9GAST|nr:sulfotransferase [Elysia marginata]
MSLDATAVPEKVPKLEPEWEGLPFHERFNCIKDSHFPPCMIPSGLMLEGVRVPMLPVPGDPTDHLMDISYAKFRGGDILVVAYPDSGGPHLVELLPWFLHQNHCPAGSANHITSSHLSQKLLEHMNRSEIEVATSPCIFLSNLWAAHFPADIIHKNIKIIHLVRNPKDVVTSLYHRLRRQGVFTFQQFLDLYLTNQIGTGHQIAFLRQMRQFQQRCPHQPVLEIHYEDIVKKPIEVMQTLGAFLNTPVSGSLCDHILSSNDFLHTLGQTDQSDHSCDGEHRHTPGAIGDWKNTFNMMQNDTFNFFLFQSLGDLNINFHYQ